MSYRLSLFSSSAFLLAAAILAGQLGLAARADELRVLPQGQQPKDVRLGPLQHLDGYFPLTVPPTKEAWEARADEVRKQLTVGLGLWPTPKKTPLNAVIHGKVERDGFTVERVYFESFPGHFVTGSLFRPTKSSGKLPGVLCPHGHSVNGRFEDRTPAQVAKEIEIGADQFADAARQGNVARAAQLARMGCVSFMYDMVGYADSQQLAHRYETRRAHMDTPENWGYFSAQAELRLQNTMGLQTWNSVRALDFLTSLPDVDATRLGVTGASGGGTQTFILPVVDSRPAVIFPVVMVSTAMQGGCTCENCDYLRVGTGNIEIAGLFAPKPLGMVGADDWTKEMDTKGYPELKALYRLYGKEENVFSKVYLQFEHNYNYPSRQLMYTWFNKHLKLGLTEPITEKEYGHLSREELTVWDDAHPKPPSGDDYERSLIKTIEADSAEQIAKQLPKDAAGLPAWKDFIGTALHAMIGRKLLAAGAVKGERIGEHDHGNYLSYPYLLNNEAAGEQLPVVFLYPKTWNKSVAIWLDGAGKKGLYGADGKLAPAVQKLVDAGWSVVGVDLFEQGEFRPDGSLCTAQRQGKNSFGHNAYTYGYNRSLFAQRVADVLSVTSYCKFHDEQPEQIVVVGLGETGPIAAAARAIAGEAIAKAAVETAGFRFASLTNGAHPQFLPGVVKYGDVPGLIAAGAPHVTRVLGEATKPELSAVVYQAAGAAGNVTTDAAQGPQAGDAATAWLLGK